MTITRSPYISNPDILFCHEARSTRPVALDFGGADMLPAGTLISCEGKAVNDLTALGVLLYDTWKGYGSGQGVVLISGHVDLAKAQEHSGLTYSSEAKAALKGICFVGDKELPAGGGGVSSWNDLTDRPFGETTVTGDTLTWDGNTEGLECVDLTEMIGNVYYRVSDATPTLADFENGFTLTFFEGGILTETNIPISDTGMGVLVSDGWHIMIAMTDNINADGFVIDKKGVYLTTAHKSLTINNYNGFETTETVPLPNKYLDIIETVGGDTLTWDGNTEGLECFDLMGDGSGYMYKISDSLPAMTEISNGVTVITETETETISADGVSAVIAQQGDVIMHGATKFLIVLNDVTSDGMTMKKGLYFAPATRSLTINGYTGFTKEQVKQEYLPSGLFVDLTKGTMTEQDGVFVYEGVPFTPILNQLKKGGSVVLFTDGCYIIPQSWQSTGSAVMIFCSMSGEQATLGLVTP